MFDPAGLDVLNAVEHGFGDVPESGLADGDGDIGAFISDATNNPELAGYGLFEGSGETHLFTDDTTAAVPLPKISLSFPAFCASIISFMLIFLSFTTKPDSGSPGTLIFPAA